jgi:hypothetical protein
MCVSKKQQYLDDDDGDTMRHGAQTEKTWSGTIVRHVSEVEIFVGEDDSGLSGVVSST